MIFLLDPIRMPEATCVVPVFISPTSYCIPNSMDKAGAFLYFVAILPTWFKMSSLILWQSYYCFSVSEATLKNRVINSYEFPIIIMFSVQNPTIFAHKYDKIPPLRSLPVINYIDHDDVIKWKHFPRYWPFVRGIHRSPVTSPHKGQLRGALIFFFDLRLNKRLSKQSWGWWFETQSRPLWRHSNGMQEVWKFHLHHSDYQWAKNWSIKMESNGFKRLSIHVCVPSDKTIEPVLFGSPGNPIYRQTDGRVSGPSKSTFVERGYNKACVHCLACIRSCNDTHLSMGWCPKDVMPVH